MWKTPETPNWDISCWRNSQSSDCCSMASAFSTLGFVIFGLWISIYVIVVESHRVLVSESLSPIPSVYLRSSPAPLPAPSPGSASPKPQPPKQRTPPPKPPPPKKSPPPRSPPPSPPHNSSDLTPPLNAPGTKQQSQQKKAGKVVGLSFLGMAGIMQIGVVGFLVFKRRQLLKTKDRYETGSWKVSLQGFSNQFISFVECIKLDWIFIINCRGEGYWLRCLRLWQKCREEICD